MLLHVFYYGNCSPIKNVTVVAPDPINIINLSCLDGYVKVDDMCRPEF